MGQSTPKKYVLELLIILNNYLILKNVPLSINMCLYFICSAAGSFCVKDTTPPFCPKTPDSTMGDSRCCLPAPEWAALF